MRSEHLQSFVLSSLDYGDSDRIVSLFTLEHGRIRAFARGARNSRKRFGAAFEMFARIDLQAQLKEGLSSLRQADVISLYPGIRGDLARIAHALYACELMDVLTPEGQPLPRLYRLLSAYLDHLETGGASEHGRRFFEINLLNILGYRPALEGCSRCGGTYLGGAVMLERGELACCLCAGGGCPVGPDTLRMLRSCLSTGKFGLIDFPAEALLQAGVLLDDAIAAHAGKRLRSVDFLVEIGA